MTPGPDTTALTSSVIRQALVPLGALYLILMGALGLGLRRLYRRGAGEAGARAGPRGWTALTRHVVATTIGGYLLLLAVVTAYYYGISPAAAVFWSSAVTGTALLIAITMPVFAAASWLSVRARRPRRRPPGQAPPPRQ